MGAADTTPSGTLAAFLRQRRDAIVDRWLRELRRAPEAPGLPAGVLRDRIPQMIEQMADEAAGREGVAVRSRATRQLHVERRLDLGFDLDTMIQEYAVLRRVLVRMLAEEGVHLEPPEWELLHETLDRGIATAARTLSELRRGQIEMLDERVGHVLSDVPDFDDALAGIGSILLATTAADSVVILLCEGDRFRVRAASGLDEPVGPFTELPLDDRWTTQLLALRDATLFTPAPDDPGTPLRPAGTLALYGVPLVSGDEVLGVVQFGTRRAVDFNEEERVLFRSTASRVHAMVSHVLLATRERTRHAAASALASATRFEDGVAELLRALAEAFRWDVASWWPLDAQGRLTLGQRWTREGARFEALAAFDREIVLKAGEGLPGAALATGTVQVWADHRLVPLASRHQTALSAGLSSAMAFTLRAGDGVLGVVELMSRRERAPIEQGEAVARTLHPYVGAFLRRLDEDERIRRSEAQKAAILDVAVDAIVSTDADDRILSWSRSAEPMFGWAAEEAVGRRLADTIVPPGYRDQYRRELAEYLETGRGRFVDERRELPFVRRDGVVFPGEVTRTRAGSDPPWFVTTVRDVTERRRALVEQHRREEEQAFLTEASRVLMTSLELDATLDRFAQLAVPALADWCVVDLVRPDGTIRRAAARHAVETLSERIWEMSRLYPPGEGVDRAALTPDPTREATVLIEETTDEWLRRLGIRDGHVALLREIGLRSMLLVPMNVHGRTIGGLTLAIATPGRSFDDATRRLALELASRAAQAVDNAQLFEQAREATRLRDDMLAVVTHDLRNPLGAIRLAAGLLERTLAGNATFARPLTSIRRSVEVMDRLIRDLRDLGAIQSGRLTIEVRPEPVSEVVAESVGLHAALAADKGLELSHRVPAEPLVACVDRARLHQVLSNLLGNALKFCRPGDRIVVEARGEPDHVHVVVTDTGPGITPEAQAHVFEPYWSGDRPREGGVGLGLFISRGIVEAHGGRMWLDSRPGAGATFHFTLPVSPRDTSEGPQGETR